MANKKKWVETPALLKKISELVHNGLDFDNQIYSVLGMSHETWNNLKKAPNSEIPETISRAIEQREMEIHQMRMEFVRGDALTLDDDGITVEIDPRLHYQAMKDHITRQDRLRGREKVELNLTFGALDEEAEKLSSADLAKIALQETK